MILFGWICHLIPAISGAWPRSRIMSTTITSMETSSESRRPPASERHPQASTATTPLILAAFAAVYILWGSTYLAIRVGVETVPPLMLAGLRHFTVGSLLY